MVKSEYHYISGQEFIKYLWKKYWIKKISQKWSHIKVECNWIKTIIPNHKVLAYWTFSWILAQLKINEDEFLDFVNNKK